MRAGRSVPAPPREPGDLDAGMAHGPERHSRKACGRVEAVSGCSPQGNDTAVHRGGDCDRARGIAVQYQRTRDHLGRRPNPANADRQEYRNETKAADFTGQPWLIPTVSRMVKAVAIDCG